MIFETIVRPFQSRPVTATRRVVSAVGEAGDPGTATLTWGEAGTVARGVKQEEGRNLELVGFNLNDCEEIWSQKGDPVTEDITTPIVTAEGGEIGTTTWKRIREIKFEKREEQGSTGSNPITNAFVASGVAESIAGLQAMVPGSGKCASTYKLRYN